MGRPTVVSALTFLFMSFFVYAIALEPFSMTTHLSADELLITDHLHVELNLNYPQGYHVDVMALRSNLMQFGTYLGAPFKLISEEVDIPQESKGKLHQKIAFTLEPQLPGKFYLSFLTIPFVPNGESNSEKAVKLLSDVYQVQILLPDPKNMPEPIAAPLLKFDSDHAIEISSDNRKLWIENSSLINEEEQRNLRKKEERSISWIGIFALLATMSLLLPFKKKKIAAEQVLIEDPRHTALENITSLRSEQMDDATFYVRLTGTVREFLEKQFHYKAQTRTTEEVLNEMTKNPVFDTETQLALVAFLQSADLVKFGKHEPSSKEREESLLAALNLIQKER